ncbi:MAG: lipoate--protein ligase family protein [Ignavibacteria bacterium]|nr:lipoate--protein ligase family protein [Ignavibacteria bacterium]
MNWIFIDSGFLTGKENMDYDVHLTNECSDDVSFLRLYRWKPYCISLGANQKIEDINSESARSDNIDIVKRPTGGRAILHAEELTYCIAMKMNGHTNHEIYSLINKALLKGLKLYSSKLNTLELEKNQINLSEFYKTHSSIPCFSSSAKYEIKFENKKLVGSAQRVFGDTILQHGSILCGDYHKNLVNYLNLPKEKLQDVKEDLNEKTISIGEIVGEEVDYSKLADCIKKGFLSFKL